MEENKSTVQVNPKPNMEHSLNLVDRKHLTISGVDKVVSVKPDLLQLKTSAGDMVVSGQNIEVTKLDLEQHTLSLNGKFDSIKYSENNKTPLLKKIFK
jgi:sporulation protein YabP